MSELLDTSGTAASYTPLVLQRLCVHASRMLGTDQAAVFVREVRRSDRMIVAAATDAELIGRRCAAGRGPAGMGIGEALYVPNYRVLDRPLTLPATGNTRVAAAPIAFSDAVRGALVVWIGAKSRAFGLRELELLGELAALVGHSLEHRATRERRWCDPELDALGADLTDADEPTARHVEHVVSLALGLGTVLGLTRVELLELELGARLHDIGKVRVPPEILRKPYELTATEWELMRLHSLWGAEMLADIAGLEAVSLVVRAHHERYDGCGYPDGLTGARIPLAGRIIAVCDAYSAMTSDRPYSAPLSTVRALRELEDGAGSQFDPAVAEALTKAIRRGGRFSRSLADDLDHQPLGATPVELGVEDLLPRA